MKNMYYAGRTLIVQLCSVLIIQSYHAEIKLISIIYGTVLFNTPDLKINNDNGHAHRTSLSGHAQSITTNSHLQRTIEPFR